MDRQQIETLVNLGVFAPLAIYALRGKRPPTWLTAASLVYVVAVAVIDGSKLLKGNPPAALPGQTVQPAPILR